MGDDFEDDDAIVDERESLVHVGYRSVRTIWDSGDLERALAFAWLDKHALWGDDHLQSLLASGGLSGDPIVTQRDASVAATIILLRGVAQARSIQDR